MKKEKVFLLLIFLLAFFLRVFRLGENPYNFQKNEVFIGSSAWSILKTGKNLNAKTLPLIFQYFEREKERHLPLYFYLSVPAVALFGLNEFSVRLPSALFGALTVLLVYFLTKRLFKKSISLTASLLLAISPWHLHLCRQASPAIISLFFILLGVLLFLKKKRVWAALVFGLSLLSFSHHWLFVLFLTSFLFFWKDWQSKKEKKAWLISCFGLFVLALLLFKLAAQSNALIFSSVFYDEFLSDLSTLEKTMTVLENYFDNLSFKFLFFSGDTYINHGVGEMGVLFLSSLPLVLIGLYQIFVIRGKEKYLLLSWLLLSFIQASFSRFSPDSEKTLAAVVPWMILTAIGGLTFFQGLAKRKKGLLRFTIYAFVFAIFAYDLLSYFHIYWVHYHKRTQSEPESAYKTLLEKVKEKKAKYEKIYITNAIDGAAVYSFFYLKYDPKIFLQEKGDRKQFGKFFFDPFSPQKEEKKTLVVTTPLVGGPPGFEKKEEIKVLNQSTIFVLWEN